MSQHEKVEEVLDKARVLEEKYDWVKAKLHYEQALRVARKGDFWRKGEIQERIGYSLYRAAFQAKTRRGFERRMRLSSEAYEKAAKLFEGLEDSERCGKTDFCKARALYNGSWLVSGSKRKMLLNECWRLQKVALKASKETGDLSGSGRLCNELLYCLYDRSLIEWKRHQLNKIVAEAVGLGETAIDALSKVRDEKELARAYSLTSLHCFYAANVSELEEKKREFGQKCLSYAEKALELSKKVGDRYLISLSNWAAATAALYFSDNITSSLEHAEKMLQQGIAIKDNYVIGVAYYQLAFIIIWMMRVEEDPDNKREGYGKAIQYAEDAIRHLCIVNNNYFVAETPIAESYSARACEVETDREEKRPLLEKAVEAGRKNLRHAQLSASPDALGSSLHELSKALYFLSNMEMKTSEKKTLLEEASKHRQAFIGIVERMYPSNYWVRGYGQNYQALIKAELAEIEPDKGRKREFLEEAASNMHNCLKLIEKWAKLFPQTRIFAVLGKYYDRFGGIINQLYWLSEDEKVLEEAIEAYGRAANTYGRAELPSRMAEAYWNIAKLYDRLGEYLKASENFEAAADVYEAAAEKIHRLNDFYSDYATYMQAWSEIEKAKHKHARGQYDKSKDHYRKAANLHHSSKRWGYLAPNYSAWAQLEKAEELSRKERNKEAIHNFQQALGLFNKAKDSIQTETKKIETSDEKEMAATLIKASDIRRRYCQARIYLEEAKTLDRTGEHDLSSKRYGSAAETLRKIIEGMESEHTRKELRPIMYLCQAWQKMASAEEKTSPELYMMASQLFAQAKKHSLNRRTSLLALGNSSFCKALSAGTEFEITLDAATYSIAKRHIESAANCYLKAGFKSASEYTKATQRLFDAYMYMNNAERETDPEKRVRCYQMAEKVLQSSVDSYRKSKHPEKSHETHKILEKVRERKKFAASLKEVLQTPPIASTTASFTTPNPTHEKAVGLERFEHANIQAQLTIPEEVTLGEELEIKLDLVNVAKNFALLVRIDDLVPKGFVVTETPPHYTIENGSINMRGKRFEPLKAESIKISARTTDSGVFKLSPQVIYVNETGEMRTYRPESVRVRVQPLLAFRFRTKAAQKVFDYLIKAFVEDYMTRRLFLEKSGWRSLMQIVRKTKISRSSVYGAKGHRGPAISELERRGLVETRVFPGERGRGGRIIKTRIFYEKETIKRYVDKKVMKNTEK